MSVYIYACVCVFGSPCISIRVAHISYTICTHYTVLYTAILVFFRSIEWFARLFIFFNSSSSFSFLCIHNIIVCALVYYCTYAAPAAILVDRGYTRHTTAQTQIYHWILSTHTHTHTQLYLYIYNIINNHNNNSSDNF